MRKFPSLLPLSLFFLCISACRPGDKKENSTQKIDGPATVEKQDLAYFDSIAAWRQKRTASLKADDGWLNLAGLYWLKEGENTLGAGEGNAMVLPKGKADVHLGSYLLENGVLHFRAADKKAVKIKGTEGFVDSLKIFPPDSGIVLGHRKLEWFLIKRGDQFGIRLRDLDSELAKSFTGVETFPVDPHWRVRAKFEPTPSRTINILNVLDQSSGENSPGTLHFELDGKEYRLDALEGGKRLFIIFGDLTNGEQTYGAGRFLYVDAPDATGHTWLDFNKAYNPPCAFTPYSTCPLPPRENLLPLAILAGEKVYE